LARISLGLAIALNLLLFVVILFARPGLDEAITLSNAVPGEAAYDALILPIIGIAGWVVGGALGLFYYNARDEAPMAYIIWGTVVLIELATWVPAITLIFGL
jgi:Mn2+/Fe2+ NRAMP family transporter